MSKQPIRLSGTVAGRFVLPLLLGAIASVFNPAAAVQWGNATQGFYEDPSRWIGGTVPTSSQSADFLGPNNALVLWADSTGNTVSSSTRIEDSEVTFTGCCGAVGIPFTHTITNDLSLRTDGALTLGNAPTEPINLTVGDDLFVGGASSNSSGGLRVLYGSKVEARRLLLESSGTAIVNIQGTGSSLTLSGTNIGTRQNSIEGDGQLTLRLSDNASANVGDFQAGGFGDGIAEVKVLNGSTFTSTGNLLFGVGLGSHDILTQVEVSGAGSQLSQIGSGFFTVQRQATLNVSSGGLISSDGIVINPDGEVNVNPGGMLDINVIGIQGGRLRKVGNYNLDADETVRIVFGGELEVGSFDNTSGGTLVHTQGHLRVTSGSFQPIAPGVGASYSLGEDGATFDFGSLAVVDLNSAASSVVPGSGTVLANGLMIARDGHALRFQESLDVLSDGQVFVQSGGTVTANEIYIQNDFEVFVEVGSHTETESVLTSETSVQIGDVFDVGQMIVSSGGRVVAGTDIRIASQGRVEGSGVLEPAGAVINRGIIAPTSAAPGASISGSEVGVLTIEGSYEQFDFDDQEAGPGVLQVDILTGGAPLGISNDTLAVTGVAVLGGQLTVNIARLFGEGFVEIGRRADILTASRILGIFDSASLPAIGGSGSNIELGLVYTPTAVTLVAVPVLTGDFNGDGTVDTSDYEVWQSTFGSTTNLAADANLDLVVDAADYTIWRDNLGATLPALTAAIPEPTAALLLALSGLASATRRR